MLRITPVRTTIPTARLLAAALPAIMVSPHRQPRQGATIINWGRTNFNGFFDFNGLNHPLEVSVAINKIFTFIVLDSTNSCVPWTGERSIAEEWVHGGVTVFARTSLTGREGSGIVVVSTPDEMVDAPLYTQYMGRRTEYRVHIVGNNTFITQKKLRNGIENPNWKVRSHKNGWIHARRDISAPADLENVARSAISAIGLDFGAVDLAHNERFGTRVLEVNTAPGLTGEALDFYVPALQSLVE